MTLNRESIQSISNWIKNKIHFKKINHIASFFVFTAIVPVMYLPMLTGVQGTSTALPSMALKTDSKNVVTSSDNLNEIIPGESQNDRIAREEAETKAAEAAKKKAAALAYATKAKAANATTSVRVYSDPSDFDQIYARAAERFGVDAAILKAIHTVETGRSGSTLRSNPSGATGPMQFLLSTWRRHGVDGNGDGIADVGNVEDAIFTAAAYLKACGYPDVKKALWGYNPSQSYYNKVMNIAYSLGFNQ